MSKRRRDGVAAILNATTPLCAAVGVQHPLVVLTPTDPWSIERFAHVVELLNTRVDGGGK